MFKDTQITAWLRMQNKLSMKQKEVLMALNILKDATFKELCHYFGTDSNSVSPRLTELQHDNHIQDKGARRGGCIVWEPVKPLRLTHVPNAFEVERFYNKIEYLVKEFKEIKKLDFELKVLKKLINDKK